MAKKKSTTSTRSSRKTAVTAKKSTSAIAAPANKFRFICDCAMAVGFALLVAGALSATNDRSTAILGASTALSREKILQEINYQRAQAALPALLTDDRLDRAAVAKGENMFADNYWAHVNPDGTEPWAFISAAGYDYQSAGENLGRDFADEKSLVEAWMASPSHRDNIMNASFSDTGLAVLDGQIDGQKVVLIVNLFAEAKKSPGTITQTATYADEGSSAVLAGQVTTRRFPLTAWQTILVAGVAVGMVAVLSRLHPKKLAIIPRRRTRRHAR